jgi:phage-related protein
VAGQKLVPIVKEMASVLLTTVTDAVKGVIDVFKLWIGVGTNLYDFFKDIFTGKWGAAWDAIKKIVDDFGKYFEELLGLLPSKGVKALESIGSDIGGVFVRAWKLIESGVTSFIGDIVRFFEAIPGDLLKALEALGSDLLNLAKAALASMLSGVKTGWSDVETFVKSIPGLILGFFKDFGSLLEDAGAKLLEGLANGVKGAVGKVTGAIKGVVDSVGHEISSGFGLFSPSTVFIGHGQNLMLGMSQGITGAAPGAIKAMQDVAKQIAAVPLTHSPITIGAIAGATQGNPNAVVSVTASGTDSILTKLAASVSSAGSSADALQNRQLAVLNEIVTAIVSGNVVRTATNAVENRQLQTLGSILTAVAGMSTTEQTDLSQIINELRAGAAPLK